MGFLRDVITKDKIWHSRARNIEIVHSDLMLRNKDWSIRKTAKYLRMCASTVCEDLQLAKYLIEDSSLERFKLRKEALKYIHD